MQSDSAKKEAFVKAMLIAQNKKAQKALEAALKQDFEVEADITEAIVGYNLKLEKYGKI